MKRLTKKHLFILIALFLSSPVFSQTDGVTAVETPKITGSEKSGKQDDVQPDSKSKNVNVDIQMVYGQYNNMYSTINFSHEQNDFVYLLSSNFKRSNDFGYKDEVYSNTSYYENRIGFTGSANFTDTWKSNFETTIDNESRGMYDNPLYSREEKDKFTLQWKNVSKLSSSSEAYLQVATSGYTHRLVARTASDEKSHLYRMNGEMGGEYIWSASNRIKTNLLFTQYLYSEENTKNDRYCKAEVIDDFLLTRYVGVSFGLNFCWNEDYGMLEWRKKKDGGVPLIPIASLTLKSLKYFSMSLSYRYDLKPFRPENYYFDLRFVNPTFDLPPARVHQAMCQADLKINNIFSLRGEGGFYAYEDYYNYVPVEGNLLSGHPIDTLLYKGKIENNITLIEKRLRVSIGYEYNHPDADEHVTYLARHAFVSGVKFTGKKWNFEWSNKLQSSVYVDPVRDDKLKNSVYGVFGAQRMCMDNFYVYVRVENLYNNRYYLREGYPEAGLTLQGGLRILI